MRKRFQKLLCFIFGHRYYSVALSNPGQEEVMCVSFFGTYKGQRCDYQEDWQYDL